MPPGVKEPQSVTAFTGIHADSGVLHCFYLWRVGAFYNADSADAIAQRKDLWPNRSCRQIMGILSWIVLGLIAGALAKLLMPGKDGGGWLLTIGLGIAGAFVGGYLGSWFGVGSISGGINLTSVATATVGAFLILWIYRLIK
jgi:uncharacterized membrane protein YeaQ/YmgE (transglycosylase-associated protein family)